MSWDARVYLAKKRIAKKRIAATYDEMRRQFGDPPDDEDGEDDDFGFAHFRLHLGEDAQAGMYLWVSNEDVARQDVEEAGHCMESWAELLGGAISEEKWNERRERAGKKKLATSKLPKHGPADTFGYFAFDAAGNEIARKSVAKEVASHLKLRILEPAWLRENGVTRIEYLSFGMDGTVGDHVTYEVDAEGTSRRIWEA